MMITIAGAERVLVSFFSGCDARSRENVMSTRTYINILVSLDKPGNLRALFFSCLYSYEHRIYVRYEFSLEHSRK
jgi:hypothetical protein